MYLFNPEQNLFHPGYISISSVWKRVQQRGSSWPWCKQPVIQSFYSLHKVFMSPLLLYFVLFLLVTSSLLTPPKYIRNNVSLSVNGTTKQFKCHSETSRLFPSMLHLSQLPSCACSARQQNDKPVSLPHSTIGCSNIHFLSNTYISWAHQGLLECYRYLENINPATIILRWY